MKLELVRQRRSLIHLSPRVLVFFAVPYPRFLYNSESPVHSWGTDLTNIDELEDPGFHVDHVYSII